MRIGVHCQERGMDVLAATTLIRPMILTKSRSSSMRVFTQP